MSEIIARYDLPVEVYLSHDVRARVADALTAAWGGKHKGGKPLQNALERLHETKVFTLHVDVDKDGSKSIRVA